MLNKRLLTKLDHLVEPLARKIHARGTALANTSYRLPYEEISTNDRQLFEQLSADTLFVLSLFEEEETIERIIHL